MYILSPRNIWLEIMNGSRSRAGSPAWVAGSVVAALAIGPAVAWKWSWRLWCGRWRESGVGGGGGVGGGVGGGAKVELAAAVVWAVELAVARAVA